MVSTRPALSGTPDAALTAEPDVEPDQPRAWWNRLETWIGLGVVAVCGMFVLWQLHPSLLLRNTTPTGGDTGAHVWWPAYLRDHLLPHWRIAGWSPDWYAGFPAGQFYFPLPALLIVALDTLLPYNVAFKLVTALGPVALPVAAYLFGRGLRAPRPAPALLAVGATGFLFFKGNGGHSALAQRIGGNQHIMGGNLASNAAGEFSFTLALALALCAVAALAWALDHRRRMWLPALLLAATVMSHLVVALFAVMGAVIVWLFHKPFRNFGAAATISIVSLLLTAVWTVPLLATRAYTTDMAYEPLTEYVSYLFPGYLLYLLPLIAAAAIGAVVRRCRFGFQLLALTALMGIAFRLWEEAITSPVWNLRLLPFWYLGLFLLAGLGAAELVRATAWLVARASREPWWELLTGAPSPGDDPDEPDQAGMAAARAVRRPPPYLRAVTIGVLTVILASVGIVRAYQTRGFLPYWARWNNTGYENVSGNAAKVYPEYKALIDTMAKLPPGRALWEPGQGIGSYGTPLALMLLPYWTHGRIASMEGLYFESSATTPYHFMAVATLSGAGNASNPQRGLPYKTIADFDVGVRYMRELGVRYYLAQSSEAKQQADRSPELVPVAASRDDDGKPPMGWRIYRVRESALVEGLRYQPVSVPGVAAGKWQDDVGVPWWDAPTNANPHDLSLLDRPLVDGGPPDWKRARPPGVSKRDAPHPDLPPVSTIERRRLPEIAVSNIRTTDHSVSFRVSRTGVPVIVKASYFPNWRAEGARGPWRATPNLMVVVPTSHQVRLDYGSTTAEWLGRVGTGLGLLGVGALAAWPWWWRRKRSSRRPDAGPESIPGPAH